MFEGHCKHYRPGPGLKIGCAKGHEVRSLVGGPTAGWMARMPCTRAAKSGLPELPGPDCPDCDPRTAEEADSERAAFMAKVARMGRGECPDCGGPMETRENDDVRLRWCVAHPDNVVRECKRAELDHDR